ncbi:MAG TPA: hypothetical protein VMN57_17235 [Anaerolineales bacterium]|nr:hypothetical protein [Anaerolineales bacterium]
MNEFFIANRKRWDELTLEHKDSEFYDLAGFRAGKDRLRSIELYELIELGYRSAVPLLKRLV